MTAEPTVRKRVAAFIRDEELIAPGAPVTVLVSGGADSTCLWHVLRELGYAVSALHVNHRASLVAEAARSWKDDDVL